MLKNLIKEVTKMSNNSNGSGSAKEQIKPFTPSGESAKDKINEQKK